MLAGISAIVVKSAESTAISSSSRHSEILQANVERKKARISGLSFLVQVVVENVYEFSVCWLLLQLVSGNADEKFPVASIPAV